MVFYPTVNKFFSKWRTPPQDTEMTKRAIQHSMWKYEQKVLERRLLNRINKVRNTDVFTK